MKSKKKYRYFGKVILIMLLMLINIMLIMLSVDYVREAVDPDWNISVGRMCRRYLGDGDYAGLYDIVWLYKDTREDIGDYRKIVASYENMIKYRTLTAASEQGIISPSGRDYGKEAVLCIEEIKQAASEVKQEQSKLIIEKFLTNVSE